MPLTAILISVLQFTFAFFIYASALSFWGKHILKIAKVSESSRPTLLLRIVAALAVMVFGAQALFPFANNSFNSYLTFFFLIGAVGAVLDFSLASLLPWLKETDKRNKFWAFVKKRDSLVAGLCLAVLMSFAYSVIWPSGQMDGWLFNSGDFHIWIFLTEYFLGGLDLANLDVLPIFSGLAEDAFGTYMIMGLTSVAFGKPAYLAASYIVVTFNVWFGMGVYALSRRIFDLTFFQALAVSSSLILGALFNYVGFIGMFGHMVFLIILVAAMTELFPEQGRQFPQSQLTRRLFFPLFLLFLSYQAGYSLLAAMLLTTGTLLGLLCPPLSGSAPFTLFWRKLSASLKGIIFPVLIATAASALLMPGMAYHLVDRSIGAAYQEAGWALEVFNPLLFSGFPLYVSESHFTGEQAIGDVSLVFYQYLIFYLVILSLLAIIIWSLIKNIKKDNKSPITYSHSNYIHCKYVVSVYLVFIFFLSVYVILVNKYDNIYRVWKFSAYLLLPLSFIFPCSLILIIKRFSEKFSIKLVTYTIFMCIIFFLIKFCSFYPFTRFPNIYFKAYTNKPFINELFLIDYYYNDKRDFIFNFFDKNKVLLTILALNNSDHKLFFIKGCYFIEPRSNYFHLISPNSIIISDIPNDNSANSIITPVENTKLDINVYDYDYIKSKGAVAWSETTPPSGLKYFHFLLASDLIGQDLQVSLKMVSADVSARKKCPNVVVNPLEESWGAVWPLNEKKSLPNVIPASYAAKGVVTISLAGTSAVISKQNPSDLPKEMNNQQIPSDYTWPLHDETCHYTISSIELNKILD